MVETIQRISIVPTSVLWSSGGNRCCLRSAAWAGCAGIEVVCRPGRSGQRQQGCHRPARPAENHEIGNLHSPQQLGLREDYDRRWDRRLGRDAEGQEQGLRGRGAELYTVALVGKDPRPITQHWQKGHLSSWVLPRRSSSDRCSERDRHGSLWDIKGKSLGLPVHELLGGPTQGRRFVFMAAVRTWMTADVPR